MSKRSPEELYRVGLEAYGVVPEQISTSKLRLLQAIAAMISQAVAPGKPREPKKEPVNNDLQATQLYDALRATCGPYIISQPKSKAWTPALSKAIADLEDYGPDDVRLLVSWLHSGALKDWPVPPNIGHLAKHFASWIGQARKWGGVGTGRANPFAGAIPKK